MGPLRPLLIAPPALPSGFDHSVRSARCLLEAIGRGEVKLDRNDQLTQSAAIALNERLEFDSPSPYASDFEDGWLEVDALVCLLRVIGASDPLGWRETLSPHGKAWIDNPSGLWTSLAGAIGCIRPSALFGEYVDSILAWLLVSEASIESLAAAMNEALDVRRSKHPDEDPDSFAQAVTNALYTVLRSLDFFEPGESRNSKPLLTSAGRAGALIALGVAASTAFCPEHAFHRPGP